MADQDVRLPSYTNWTTQQVICWFQGLDNIIDPYITILSEKKLNGKWLSTVTPDDLEQLGVAKIGHQMIILQKIRHLQSQYSLFENETLQTVLFRVYRTCASTVAAIKSLICITGRQDVDVDNVYLGISEDIQEAVVHIMSNILSLMNAIQTAAFWLERNPFQLLPEMNSLRKYLLTEALEVNDCSQRVTSSQSNEVYKKILNHVDMIRERVGVLIQTCNDSIMLTLCDTELVQIVKNDTAEFGLRLHSTVNHVHFIASVANQSPAFCCGKLHKGDEIIEVNDQIVIGWEHSRLVDFIRRFPRRITIRLLKRPTHTTDFAGFPGGGRRHRLLTQQNPPVGAFPQRVRNNYVPMRTPKRRAPLVEPLLSPTLASTQESPDLPPKNFSEQSGASFASAASHFCSPSSSSSSSSRTPSMKIHKKTSLMDSVLTESSVYSNADERICPTSVRSMRMFVSTPSTPLITAKNLASGRDDHKVGSTSDLTETSATMSQFPSERQMFPNKDASKIDKVPVSTWSNCYTYQLPPPAPFHRRTASGGPTLISTEPGFQSESSNSCQPIHLGALKSTKSLSVTGIDKKSKSRLLGSWDDLRFLRFGSKKPNQCVLTNQGECRGWLWMWTGRNRYAKRWCTFQNSKLYIYRNAESEAPEYVIPIQESIVKPMTEGKSNRFVFQITTHRAQFVLASESEQDRSKWMNILGLAAIGVAVSLPYSRIGGFHPGYITPPYEHLKNPSGKVRASSARGGLPPMHFLSPVHNHPGGQRMDLTGAEADGLPVVNKSLSFPSARGLVSSLALNTGSPDSNHSMTESHIDGVMATPVDPSAEHSESEGELGISDELSSVSIQLNLFTGNNKDTDNSLHSNLITNTHSTASTSVTTSPSTVPVVHVQESYLSSPPVGSFTSSAGSERLASIRYPISGCSDV